MKIAATSDIHYDLISSESDYDELRRLINSLEAEKPDVLLIAGDIVGLGVSKLEECLGLFEKICTERLIVLGNHDYWSEDLDTFKRLELLRSKIDSCGFHLLDKSLKIIRDIGFAGNCGWYDYSFADGRPPTGSSYEKKMFNGYVIWNDAVFVQLAKTDKEYTDELLEKLETDIKNLEDRVDTIIAMTHHIGFQEMVIRKENDAEWNFINAFMGSKSIGEMLLQHPKVKYHICGHTHSKSRLEKEHLVSLNPGSTYYRKKFVVFEA